jgi:hypothetical protein
VITVAARFPHVRTRWGSAALRQIRYRHALAAPRRAFRTKSSASIEESHVDLGYQLKRAAGPALGGQREVVALAAESEERHLDRSRPLREMVIVEGVEHGHLAVDRQAQPRHEAERRVEKREARRF